MPVTNTIFQLTFPSDLWKETTVHTFEGPYDSGVQHNLVLVVDPFIRKGMSLVDYAHVQLESSKTTMPGFELVSEIEKNMPNGVPTLEIVYKYIPSDGNILFQKQIYLLQEKKACVFTSTFSKKTLKTIAHEIDDIIASFTMFSSKGLGQY